MLDINKFKDKILKKYYHKLNSTGCCESQIILLTFRINRLQNHFLNYKKDFHSKRGFLKLIFKRRKLLYYFKNYNFKKYKKLLKILKIRH